MIIERWIVGFCWQSSWISYHRKKHNAFAEIDSMQGSWVCFGLQAKINGKVRTRSTATNSQRSSRLKIRVADYVGSTITTQKTKWACREKRHISVKRCHKQDDQPNQAMPWCMHVLSFLTNQLPITRHTGTTGGTIRTLPIYTSRSYVQSLHNVVSVPADKHKI